MKTKTKRKRKIPKRMRKKSTRKTKTKTKRKLPNRKGMVNTMTDAAVKKEEVESTEPENEETKLSETTTEETKPPEPPKHPIEELPTEHQIQLWKVRATNFELAALNNQINAMREAQTRATIEVQTLPGKIDELQKKLGEKQQSGQVEYNKLKEMLECPEGKDLDLETGKIIGS
jgi:hypothetical protein